MVVRTLHTSPYGALDPCTMAPNHGSRQLGSMAVPKRTNLGCALRLVHVFDIVGILAEWTGQVTAAPMTPSITFRLKIHAWRSLHAGEDHGGFFRDMAVQVGGRSFYGSAAPGATAALRAGARSNAPGATREAIQIAHAGETSDCSSLTSGVRGDCHNNSIPSFRLGAIESLIGRT
jgi:hypothetical protein